MFQWKTLQEQGMIVYKINIVASEFWSDNFSSQKLNCLNCFDLGTHLPDCGIINNQSLSGNNKIHLHQINN